MHGRRIWCRRVLGLGGRDRKLRFSLLRGVENAGSCGRERGDEVWFSIERRMRWFVSVIWKIGLLEMWK